jgi:hypothetical protein
MTRPTRIKALCGTSLRKKKEQKLQKPLLQATELKPRKKQNLGGSTSSLKKRNNRPFYSWTFFTITQNPFPYSGYLPRSSSIAYSVTLGESKRIKKKLGRPSQTSQKKQQGEPLIYFFNSSCMQMGRHGRMMLQL